MKHLEYKEWLAFHRLKEEPSEECDECNGEGEYHECGDPHCLCSNCWVKHCRHCNGTGQISPTYAFYLEQVKLDAKKLELTTFKCS